MNYLSSGKYNEDSLTTYFTCFLEKYVHISLPTAVNILYSVKHIKYIIFSYSDKMDDRRLIYELVLKEQDMNIFTSK